MGKSNHPEVMLGMTCDSWALMFEGELMGKKLVLVRRNFDEVLDWCAGFDLGLKLPRLLYVMWMCFLDIESWAFCKEWSLIICFSPAFDVWYEVSWVRSCTQSGFFSDLEIISYSLLCRLALGWGWWWTKTDSDIQVGMFIPTSFALQVPNRGVYWQPKYLLTSV